MTQEAIPTPVDQPLNKRNRDIRINLADNGYVVRIIDSNYHEVELVFTNQTAMLRTVKEATSMKEEE